MLYPNNIKKNIKRNVSFANRGMDLEELINEANNYYLDTDKAVIYKKPTPVKIKKVTYKNNLPEVDGYLNQKSTLDYVGLYKGKYLDFDVKKTLNNTCFPLNNIHNHQINHMKRIIKHKGISFLLIDINNKVYLLKGEDILLFIENNTRKSIPYEFIKEKGFLINYGFNPIIDYLKIIDKVYFEGE